MGLKEVAFHTFKREGDVMVIHVLDWLIFIVLQLFSLFRSIILKFVLQDLVILFFMVPVVEYNFSCFGISTLPPITNF